MQVGQGGQVVVFAATLPTVGPGALKAREDETSLYDTDKETTLYAPRDDIWQELGQQCAEEGIGVSIFLGMHKAVDIATIGMCNLMDEGRFDVAFLQVA